MHSNCPPHPLDPYFAAFKTVSLHFRRQILRTILILCVALLAACSGTGGIIGGLVPAPKFLEGTIEGTKYVAPNNAFSVNLPYSPTGSRSDQYEWTYAKVHEIADAPVVGVVIGPGAFVRIYYHAVLIRAERGEDRRTELTDELFASKVAMRTGAYELKSRQTFKVDGRTCYYAVYESPDAYLILSLTDAADSFFVVEADINKKSAVNIPDSTQQLVDRTWPVFNNMLESFTVGDGS